MQAKMLNQIVNSNKQKFLSYDVNLSSLLLQKAINVLPKKTNQPFMKQAHSTQGQFKQLNIQNSQ